MIQSIINVGPYKYLMEYFNADTDMLNSQHYGEFVMLRNFTLMNNIVYDKDIYIIDRNYFNEYVEELKASGKDYGDTLAFPITYSKFNSYSNSYKKFNDIFNIFDDNINSALFDVDGNLNTNVYELYGIKKDGSKKKLETKIIKCDKIKLYHPLIKKKNNMIVDICNYINGINFHYLCRPTNLYKVKTETEIRLNNETYSEYIELYFPNISALFKTDDEGNYEVYYKEDFNIIASTQNENFINSIMSNSEDIIHSEQIENCQIVPLNLLIQPYRIIEEYAADSEFNYNNTVADDEKMFVKLYLKNNLASLNNYSSNLSVILYPYKGIDNDNNMYLIRNGLTPGYYNFVNKSKFKLMSRTGFNDGIISIVTLFEYPNKSYFYSKYKDDTTTSPLKEAYKYYNNIDDQYYNLFINEEIEQELRDIDAVESLSPEIIQIVKEVANVNEKNPDKAKMLKIWKDIMKESIIKEYEDEFKTPANFLGFKIQIASNVSFKHIIYDKNVRVNFNDLDDFSFKINNIFTGWNEKPEQLIVKILFYDRLLGIELVSNLVIITKEWFKYLINENNAVYRLNNLSFLNKNIKDMKTVNLELDLNNKIVEAFCSAIELIRKQIDNSGVSFNDNRIILSNSIYDAEKNRFETNLESIINIKIIDNILGLYNESINELKNNFNVDTSLLVTDSLINQREAIKDAYDKATVIAVNNFKNKLYNIEGLNTINFINSIKCIVNKDERRTSQVTKDYNQKIILKPIFYKTKDLQNISLKRNISQNIGINLSEYVSKIDTFKIIIEDSEYVEIGRNNIFVIFNINSNNIQNSSGTYNLIDNTGNYISSGNWTLI